MHGWISWLQEIFPAWGGWREIWTWTGLCQCFVTKSGHSFAHLSDWWMLKILLKFLRCNLNCLIMTLQLICILLSSQNLIFLCQLNPFHISNHISLREVLINMTFILNMSILNFLTCSWLGNVLPIHLVMERKSYMKLSIVSLQLMISLKKRC